jgi:hypothetical protein
VCKKFSVVAVGLVYSPEMSGTNSTATICVKHGVAQMVVKFLTRGMLLHDQSVDLNPEPRVVAG